MLALFVYCIVFLCLFEDMPPRKKVIGASFPLERKTPQHSVDKATAVNNRRRDLYKQLSADKKETLLLQRRTRRQESNNQNLLAECLPSLPNTQAQLTRQRGITIREPPCQRPIGSTFSNDSSTAVQGKGKNIVSSLCICEPGSTSVAPIDQDNPNATSSRQESNNQNPVTGCLPPLPNTQLRLTGQRGSAIIEPPCQPPTGSTSVAPTEQNNLNSTTIASKASSSTSLQQHNPKAMAAKNTGGSGKTFLYRALLATIRSKGFIALETATSGVAASILPGGRTAHSHFKIPINIDEQFSCNIRSQGWLPMLVQDISNNLQKPPLTMQTIHAL